MVTRGNLAVGSASSKQALRGHHKPTLAATRAATILASMHSHGPHPTASSLSPPERQHILTVALEDYFHVGAFNELIQQGAWYRFELRLEQGTRHTLDLLDEYNARATFFALGWVADTMPELIREVVQRGHEVASKGYYHRDTTYLTPDELRDDLARAREALERASGQRVLGHRLAHRSIGPQDMWALDLLAEEGYAYDSSVVPIGRRFADVPAQRFLHTHHTRSGSLVEVPISTIEVLGTLLPFAGGNYLRQLPPALVHTAARRWIRQFDAPLVMYFHTWELDANQPRISAAPLWQRVRHYRNLEQVPERLAWFLKQWRFVSVAEYLGISAQLHAEPAEASPVPSVAGFSRVATPAEQEVSQVESRTPVTVVVPCHNEELILPYLANTLESVRRLLAARYTLEFVFVDDGSSDGTLTSLRRLFGDRADCQVVTLPNNQGVAAAIMSGIAHARTEIVCSIDCDCTYDPHELDQMIPLLGEEAAMVTASPYHALGSVRNVPRWRLALSLNLSRLYRLVLHNALATYTSCFRVYRRSAVADVRLTRTGFLGVAELLARLDLGGALIVEFPTTLEVRVLGRSKLRVLRIIGGHLVLLGRLAWCRLRGLRAWPARPAYPTPQPAATDHFSV